MLFGVCSKLMNKVLFSVPNLSAAGPGLQIHTAGKMCQGSARVDLMFPGLPFPRDFTALGGVFILSVLD